MSRAMFFNVPVHGHLNPTLPIVAELVARGEEVVYYSTEDFRAKIEQTGASFRSYGSDFTYDLSGPNQNFFNLAAVLAERNSDLLHRILNQVIEAKPDYIVHDAVCLWGKSIAQIFDIPAISSITTFALNWQTIATSPGFLLGTTELLLRGVPSVLKFEIEASRIAKAYGVKRPRLLDAFVNQEELNIVYTSRYFQPFSRSFDQTFKFVGPSISLRHENVAFPFDRLDQDGVIYVSMGTVHNQQLDFYHMCFDAFADMDRQVVLSVGKGVDLSRLKDIPENFIVQDYVPQLEVLQRACLFVTHGGMNSVSEALYYHVPLVVIPQTVEQALVASRVASLGAGVYLKRSRTTARSLRAAAAKVQSSEAFRSNTIPIGESFRSAGGYQQAVDAILGFRAGAL